MPARSLFPAAEETRSLSKTNLLKGFFVSVNGEDTRVVDSNEAVLVRVREEEERRRLLREQELSAYAEEEEGEAEFTEGLGAEHLDALISEDAESAVIRTGNREELEKVNEELESARAELEDLRAEAEGILSEAREEAENMKNAAFSQGKDEGYQVGMTEGMASVEALKQEVEEEALRLEQEYQDKIAELEPKFVDALTDIYEHIFKVDLENYRSIVISLLTDAIINSEGARNIIVHISKDDFPTVQEKKEEILSEVGLTEDNIEFVMDQTLGPASCMIETENGVYDCSLETELKELKRKLMLLSFSGMNET